jgi:hypothetical protein
MKFAYADPPYPGQSADLYGAHPDYAGEVDHAELIERLCRDYPDGWALSTSPRALRAILPICPDNNIWVAAWHKTNSPPIRTTGRMIWTWEPVIIHKGRQKRGERPDVRDGLACGQLSAFPGQKPPAFTKWVLNLLGAMPGDTIDDLYPGSGGVATVLGELASQAELPEIMTLDGQPAGHHHGHLTGIGKLRRGRLGQDHSPEWT